MSVLHLVRDLRELQQVISCEGVALRTYAGRNDAGVWLALRDATFSGLNPGIGPWVEEDFHREFLEQAWWKPDWLWFATWKNEAEIWHTVGTVCLAVRPGRDGPIASARWLAVLPEYRGRGIGRLLMATLEKAAFATGHRRIHVETHSRWAEAVRFYEKLGYR